MIFPFKKAEILKIIFSGKPPNITLRVMTRIEEPFVMIRKEKDGIPLTGNSRFEVYFRFRHFSLRRMKKKEMDHFLKKCWKPKNLLFLKNIFV